MLRMDPSSLRRAAEQLKRTTEEHATWHEDVLRSVFCDDFGAQDAVLASAAHRDCSFGRWFYDEAPNSLRDQPAFVATGKEHQRLHQVAARMLRAAKGGAPVARPDFEDLVATSARLRMQVDYLRSSIEAALGNRDPLTGALGRVAMLPDLHDLRSGVEHGSQPCTLVFMDVDQLKLINDEHGHDAGDLALKRVADIARQMSRDSDMLFRLGGDEFVLYLPGVGAQGATVIAQRLRVAVAQPAVAGGRTLTVSIGVAERRPEDNVESWLRAADAALYAAKQGGRNRVV